MNNMANIGNSCAYMFLWVRKFCNVLSHEDGAKICQGNLGYYKCSTEEEPFLCKTLVFQNNVRFLGFENYDENIPNGCPIWDAELLVVFGVILVLMVCLKW